MPRVSVFVSQDIRYDSPIDGSPITSKQARIEDMKRSGCIEYDPGMRQDYERRGKESEAKLEKIFDASIDEALAQMPSRKREQLEQELAGGATAEPVRVTAAAKPITTEVSNV